MIERFYQASKYEHRYRHQIGDDLVLAKEVENYPTIDTTIGPHEAIGFTTPLTRYLPAPSTPPRANLQAPHNCPRILTRDTLTWPMASGGR